MGETWKPGDETIITRPPSPEVLDRWAREDKQREITWSIITRGWLDAYHRGELTLKKLCEHTQRALKRPHVPEGTRHRWLGDVVNQALAIEPKRSRRNPGEPRWPWLGKISVELVERVQQQERLPVNRASANNRGHSAFERVAKIWRDHGVTVTAARIEKWYYPSKRKQHASPARKRASTSKRKKADAR